MHNGQPKRKRMVLSGVEGLLEIVGLEVKAKVSILVHIRRAGWREFQIVGTATLKLRVPVAVTDCTLSNLACGISLHPKGGHRMESRLQGRQQ